MYSSINFPLSCMIICRRYIAIPKFTPRHITDIIIAPIAPFFAILISLFIPFITAILLSSSNHAAISGLCVVHNITKLIPSMYRQTLPIKTLKNIICMAPSKGLLGRSDSFNHHSRGWVYSFSLFQYLPPLNLFYLFLQFRYWLHYCFYRVDIYI